MLALDVVTVFRCQHVHEGVRYQTTTEFFSKSTVHSGWHSFVLRLDNSFSHGVVVICVGVTWNHVGVLDQSWADGAPIGSGFLH